MVVLPDNWRRTNRRSDTTPQQAPLLGTELRGRCAANYPALAERKGYMAAAAAASDRGPCQV